MPNSPNTYQKSTADPVKIPQETLDQIKSDLPKYLERMGVRLRWREQESKFECLCPLHEDQHPSFQAKFKDGTWVWKCFPCDLGGTTIDLHMALHGIPTRTAMFQLAGLEEPLLKRSKPKLGQSQRRSTPSVKTKTKPQQILWRDLHTGTRDELEQVRQLRKFPPSDGLDIAQRCDVLRFGTNRGLRAWAIIRVGDDGEPDVLEWRRMDGKLWNHDGKSDTWVRYDGAKKQLIGTRLLGEYENVILVEGSPDFLAAFVALELEDAIADWCTVGMMGSGSMEEADLKLLAGHRVRIAAHNEHKFKAARTWAKQLRGVGCAVEPLNLKGRDLDEWVSGGGRIFHG